MVLFFFYYRCLSSRWDKPAQPKQSVDVRQQGSKDNAAQSLSGVLSTDNPSNSMSEAPETAGKPQGGVEMAAAMAAKINAMLMAKGKLLTPPPLLAKVMTPFLYDVSNGVFKSFCESLYFTFCFRLQVHLFQPSPRRWLSQRSTLMMCL